MSISNEYFCSYFYIFHFLTTAEHFAQQNGVPTHPTVSCEFSEVKMVWSAFYADRHFPALTQCGVREGTGSLLVGEYPGGKSRQQVL